MVGWRAGPGLEKDEPQHKVMGKITPELIKLLGIKYSVLPKDKENSEKIIKEAKEYMEKTGNIYAILITDKTFEEYVPLKQNLQKSDMKREEVLKIITDLIGKEGIIVSTTGKTSRELFEYREGKKFGHQNDFLMVGSMGLAASFGAEIALQKPDRKIFIFDGDGAVIMSAGVLSTIGYYAPENLYHIVFDNRSHDSTGGQPTTSKSIDFKNLALSNSYQGAEVVQTREKLKEAMGKIAEKAGPQMLVVKVKRGARTNLGSPSVSPSENKKAFMDYLLWHKK